MMKMRNEKRASERPPFTQIDLKMPLFGNKNMFNAIISQTDNIVKHFDHNKIKLSISKTSVIPGDKISTIMDNKYLTTQEWIACVRSGHAYGAIVKGKAIRENFELRSEITIEVSEILEDAVKNPFYVAYGFIAYATDEVTRLVFKLDKPLGTANRYEDVANQLNKKLNGSMGIIRATHIFFTDSLKGEIQVNGKLLPLNLFPRTYVPASNASEISAEQLLRDAIASTHEGRRSRDAFNLAAQLKKLHVMYVAAKRIIFSFQGAVSGITEYTEEEANFALDTVYASRSMEELDIAKMAAEAGILKMSSNVKKSFYALLSVFQQVGCSKNATVSMSRISKEGSKFHIDRMTISRHLAELNKLGIITVQDNGEKKAFSYTLNLSQEIKDKVAQIDTTCGDGLRLRIATLEFEELNGTAFAAIGSRILPQLAKNEEEISSHFGSSAQKIISSLSGRDDGVVNQLELAKIAGVSRNCVNYTVKSLAEQNIVTLIPEGRNTRITLSAHYRSRIDTITPSLNTFGRDLFREIEDLYTKIEQRDFVMRNSINRSEIEKARKEKSEFYREIQLVADKKEMAYQRRLQYAKTNSINVLNVPRIP